MRKWLAGSGEDSTMGECRLALQPSSSQELRGSRMCMQTLDSNHLEVFARQPGGPLDTFPGQEMLVSRVSASTHFQ